MKFKNVIEKWPTSSELARELTDEMGTTVSAFTIVNWKVKNSIPAKYWKSLIKISDRNGYSITSELLIDLAAKKAA